MDTTLQLEFVTLVRTHRNILGNVCAKYCPNNMTTDELIDEVIAIAWEAWPKFRKECKSSTWLYALARNVSIDRLRRFTTAPKIIYVNPLEFNMSQIPDEGGKDLRLFHKKKKHFDKMISSLSEKEQNLILMYAEGKSYTDMAEILNENENRLRVRVSRIKQRLKEAYPYCG